MFGFDVITRGDIAVCGHSPCHLVDLNNSDLFFRLTFFIVAGSLASMGDTMIVDVDEGVSTCPICDIIKY